jgi:hypothetical protein
VILLAHRVPGTSLHWTADEDKTWNGPVKIDTVGSAYPSMVELPDGLVYCVYYEEGKGSSIRGVRLRVDKEGVAVEGLRSNGQLSTPRFSFLPLGTEASSQYIVRQRQHWPRKEWASFSDTNVNV